MLYEFWLKSKAYSKAIMILGIICGIVSLLLGALIGLFSDKLSGPIMMAILGMAIPFVYFVVMVFLNGPPSDQRCFVIMTLAGLMVLGLLSAGTAGYLSFKIIIPEAWPLFVKNFTAGFLVPAIFIFIVILLERVWMFLKPSYE